MKKETLYLDTSVPSAYFDERTRERRQATEKFWMETLPRYQACVSEITLEELAVSAALGFLCTPDGSDVIALERHADLLAVKS